MSKITVGGFIRSVELSDGYASVRPRYFLEDGYTYDVVHNNVVIISAAIPFFSNTHGRIMLMSSDPTNHPMSLSVIGDEVKKH